MELIYAMGILALGAMFFNVRADVRRNQLSLERIEQSAEHIAQIAADVSAKTDAILGRLAASGD